MKRSIITALAATLVLGTTMAADAVRQHRLAEDAQAIEQAWTAWALGGSSNALLAKDFCGEIVEGKFFLTVTIGTGATELDCTIPSGMQAVASPFGAFSWAPTDGKTGTKLFNATFGYQGCRAQSREGRCRRGRPCRRVRCFVRSRSISRLSPGTPSNSWTPRSRAIPRRSSPVGGSTSSDRCRREATRSTWRRVKGSDGFSLRYNVTVT